MLGGILGHWGSSWGMLGVLGSMGVGFGFGNS